MINYLLLYPSQLFTYEQLKPLITKYSIKTILLWEDPCCFGDRKGDSFGRNILKLNKLRIAYMKATCDAYEEYLKKNLTVKRYKVDDLWKLSLKKRYEFTKDTVHIIEPGDNLLIERIKKNATFTIMLHDSPQWLASTKLLDILRSGKKRLQHSSFYNRMKLEFKDLHLLNDTPSQDKENRKALSKDALESIPEVKPYKNANHTKWVKPAIEWTNKHPIFSKYAGPDASEMESILMQLPLTHSETMDWLNEFLKYRFNLFGPYEDAMASDLPFSKRYIYHSGLSTMLNNGLLTPKDVLVYTKNYMHSHNITIASYEGFVRQILGWREYCRLYYCHFDNKSILKNTWNAKNKLGNDWYNPNAPTDKNPVSAAIYKAWSTGYLHHIERLMVLSNWMTLNKIHPDEVYSWFYEFALDSYPWVMVFNVYSMGTWSDGGLAMRKPYISSANYLIKMGHYSQKELWVDKWNKIYKSFISKNRSVLSHTILAS